MKKAPKRLSLSTETIRALQAEDLAHVHGGSIVSSGTSVISVSSGTSIINPGTSVQTIGTSGTSIRLH